MKVNFLKRMMAASVIGVVSLLGTSVVSAQQRGRERGRQPQQEQRQEQRQVSQQQRTSQQQERLAQQQQRVEQQRQQQVLQQQRLVLQRQQEQQRLSVQRRQQQQLAIQRQQQQLALQRQQEQLRQERLRQEQIRLQNERNRNRSVYTTPNNRGNRGYRVYRNGGYYQTDQNGLSVLQQAVNYGYQQGVRAGQSDRASGRGFNYQNPAAYRSANYGYSYVDSNEYQYYFREGFRRGYEDGYNSRFQYGSNSNGKLNILAAILQQVLNFQAF